MRGFSASTPRTFFLQSCSPLHTVCDSGRQPFVPADRRHLCCPSVGVYCGAHRPGVSAPSRHTSSGVISAMLRMPSSAMSRSTSSCSRPIARRPRLPADHRRIEERPADEDEMRAERERLDDVGAAPDAAVQDHRHALAGAAIAGSTRKGDAAPSSWRPPWLDTMTPSPPISRAMRGIRRRKETFHHQLARPAPRISSRSVQASWSRRRCAHERSATAPAGRASRRMFSKCGMPWFISVRSQCRTASADGSWRRRRLAASAAAATWKPARMLFSRLAETGTSAVTTNVSIAGRLDAIDQRLDARRVAGEIGLKPGPGIARRRPPALISDAAAQDHRHVHRGGGTRQHDIAPIGGQRRGSAHRRDPERRRVGLAEQRRRLVCDARRRSARAEGSRISAKAARLSCSDASVSVPPEMKPKSNFGRWRPPPARNRRARGSAACRAEPPFAGAPPGQGGGPHLRQALARWRAARPPSCAACSGRCHAKRRGTCEQSFHKRRPRRIAPRACNSAGDQSLRAKASWMKSSSMR